MELSIAATTWRGAETAYMTRKPVTLRSKISSSYLSDSSALSGASSARTAFNKPDPVCAGSMRTGCISDKMRVPPIGRAEDGAMDSDTNKLSSEIPTRKKEREA